MKPTIESLENSVWPEPDFDSSLVRTAHALRKKPIDELTPGDLRVAFGQNVGADFLKDRVLAVLREQPAIDATYFEGDLLLSVMRAAQFRLDAEFRKKVLVLADQAMPLIEHAPTTKEIEELRKGDDGIDNSGLRPSASD